MNIFEQGLDKLKQRQQLLAILIFAFVAVIIWIMISLFTSQQRTEISNDLLKLSQPLTPAINQEVINQIRDKSLYKTEELEDFPIYMITQDYNNQESVVEIGSDIGIGFEEPVPTPNPSPVPSPEPQGDTDLETPPAGTESASGASSAQDATDSATTSN